MAILTLSGHVARALDFYNKPSIYSAIGKYTEWKQGDCRELIDGYDPSIDYNLNPPSPAITDDMLEIIGYKKVEFRAMVVQDDEGTLIYRNTNWRIVMPDQAVAEGARWVYISTTLSYSELPTDKPYRQVGVYTGLVPKPDIPESQYTLLPEEVEDQGILEVLDHRKPVYRDSDIREFIKLVIEF